MWLCVSRSSPTFDRVFSVLSGLTGKLGDVTAGVAKLADAPGLGPGPFGDGGSNPLARTL
jgi:hypothetical protein